MENMSPQELLDVDGGRFSNHEPTEDQIPKDPLDPRKDQHLIIWW